MDAESVANFARTVPPGMDASDGVLTISDWCVGELRRFGVTKPIGRFYLGYDIPAEPKQNGGREAEPATWPAGLWEGGVPVFLMVGTIATSKGHPVALQAFESLWAQGTECRLLMVGRPGWEVDTLIRDLNQHPERDRRLFLVHGASDTMVDEAFRRAHAAIIGSVVEGFGLPLVEALARTLPVIASDIEIFREIAGDTVLRYEQSEPEALAGAVATMLVERETYAQRARQFRWIDWNGSRDAFAQEVDRLAKQVGK
jgi:alpha-1,2-rhamnosyltransferase